ncbi:MATE family efflux transporter [Phycisphaerales bacterium AB-hyl4]|uniref:Multidrug-efflux transporter n=1 Tax=Natronomicrosphaera hydrolytica TaxID=3242702 RepID=A0ABV4UAA9_9BACT
MPRQRPQSSGESGTGDLTLPQVPRNGRAASATGPLRRELSGKLAGRSLPGQVWVLALWPFLEQLLNSAVGFVDTALAGRLGVPAANAVAVTGYIGWLLGMLHMAVGIGAGALVARAIGGKHKRVANAGLGQALLLAVVWGTLTGVAILLAARPIGLVFGLRGEALELCVVYIRIFCAAAPMAAILFIGAACLRASGDTRTPFFAMLLVNAVNVTLSVLLVFGPEPIGGWGVQGIAIGTAAAWVVGAALILGVLLRGNGVIRLHLHRLRPHMHTANRIVRVGVPSLIESSGMWIGNALVAMIIGRLAAEAALGAHIIAIRVEALAFLPAMAIGTAAATLTGQYLGLGDPHRAKQAAGLCWLFGAVMSLVMGAVFMLFPEQLARMLTDEPELYELAAPLIFIVGPVQLFFGTYLVFSQALRGAGDTTVAMAMTYFSTFAIRLPGVWLLGVYWDMGLYGVWIALCVELVIRGLLFAGRFLHGGWTKVKV